MTVEHWLRGHFHGLGSQIEMNTLAVAAISPLQARPIALRATALNDQVEDYIAEPEFMKGLNYALSTLYYAMSAAITGGTKSEQRGNRRITIGGYPLTTKDREAFRAEAIRLRKMLGCELEEQADVTGGMMNLTNFKSK